MSKAKLSRKRVVLRRAAKRRARYDAAGTEFVSAGPVAPLRWRSGAEPGRPAWLTLETATPEPVHP